MSTILKALRRVEKEHPAQPQRRSMRGDIVAGPGKPPTPRRKKSRGPNLLMWGSLGAALLLAVLVWWRLPTAEDADLVAAQPPVAVERTPTPAAAPAARPPPEPIAAALEPTAALEPAAAAVPAAAPAAAAPVASPDLPVEVAQQLPPLGETLDAPIPEPTPAAAPVPSPAIEPTAPPAPPAPSPSAEPAAPVAHEPPPPPVPPAPAPVAKSPPPAAPPPAAKPPPVAAKRVLAPPPTSAPTIQVERISWHPKPERRLAWVRLEGSAAGREVHEGDALGTLVVKEIRPSAVVFLHGAEQLSRRVGEH